MPHWKLFLVIATLMLSGRGLQAQAPPTAPGPSELQRCLLNTPPQTWTSLKLSPDQLRRIGYVQEACGEECDAAGMKKDPNAISNADGSTVMAEVKNILTEDQYTAWVKLCAAGTFSTPPK
jgi:hypothetical protein